MTHILYKASALLAALGLVSQAACGQPNASPGELNRKGEWHQAALVAERMLREPNSLESAQRCEVRFNLSYAYSMTGRKPQARVEALRVVSECATGGESWVVAESRKLADELDPNRIAKPTIRDTDGWKVVAPAALKLDTAALAEHLLLCRNSGADACLVAYHGQIVQEWYAPSYTEPVASMSSVKSWTALLAAMLVMDGKLKFDDPVSKWIPEWQAGAAAGATVRHLLTMTAGLANRGPGSGKTSVGTVGDKNAFVFTLPLDYKPGSQWSYSNEGVQLLSPILERAAGIQLEDYARERLFKPLRMLDTEMRLDAAGNVWTYADSKTTLRNFTRICQLALDRGNAFGTQIVTRELMDTLASPIPQNPNYGMLWWLDRDPTVHATRGTHDTDCYAFPELGLVVGRIQAAVSSTATAQYGREPSVGPEAKRLLQRIVAGARK